MLCRVLRIDVLYYVAVVILAATYPLSSQTVGTFPLISNSDSRVVDFASDVSNSKVLALYSNGQCDKISLTDGNVEKLELPSGVGFQWICADSNGWWGLAYGGDLFHSTTLDEWVKAKRGIGCMYSDAERNVYMYTGKSVDRISWASGSLVEHQVIPIATEIIANGLLMRGDTAIFSAQYDTVLVVVTRDESWNINGVNFVKALDLGDGEQVITDYRYFHRLNGTNKSTVRTEYLNGRLNILLGLFLGYQDGSRVACVSGLQRLGNSFNRVFGLVHGGTERVYSIPSEVVQPVEHAVVYDKALMCRFDAGGYGVLRDGIQLGSQDSNRKGLRADTRVLGYYPRDIRGVQTHTFMRNQVREQRRLIGEYESSTLDTIEIDTQAIVESYIENEDGVGILVTRPWIFRKTSNAQFVQIAPVLYKDGFSKAAPISIGDSMFVVANSVNHFSFSYDTGLTWKLRVVRGLRNYPVNILSDSKTIVFASRYEIAIASLDDHSDTIGDRLYRPMLSSPIGVLGIKDSVVRIFRTYHSRGVVDSIDRIWLVNLYRSGASDSVSLALPKTLPAYWSIVRGATFGDTTCLYAHFANLSFFVSIVGDRVVEYHINNDLSTSSITSVSSYSMDVRSKGAVEFLNITEGVRFVFDYLKQDTTTSVVDQNISHYYVNSVNPNPASTTITAQLGKFATADKSTVRLELWTVNGEFVRDYSRELPKFGAGPEQGLVSLDINGISQGLYLLVIKNAQSTHAHKVIISR